MLDFGDAITSTALFKIIAVNILLSGDNAIVIALACRSLPPIQQKRTIFIGTLIAILFRAIFTHFTALLLSVPFLKLIGSILLFYIAVKFLLPEMDSFDEMDTAGKVSSALKKVVLADLVMSLDNIIGVAAVADGNFKLLIFGLIISMPIITFGSTVTLRLMRRFIFLPTLGAGFLGYIAFDMGVSDIAVSAYIHAPVAYSLGPVAGGLMVVLLARSIIFFKEKKALPGLPAQLRTQETIDKIKDV